MVPAAFAAHGPPPRTALVIGAGVIGRSIAFRLQRCGIATTLVDLEASPRGPSWGNAGHLAVEQVAPLASRLKQVIGDGLRSQTDERQVTEVGVAVHVLNRMLELGRPNSVRIA